jgi:hypothetical protein
MEQLRKLMLCISSGPDRRNAYVALLKSQTLSVPQFQALLDDAANLRPY